MKQIIIIIFLCAFTIIGFYVNRGYWIGLFKPPPLPEPKEIIEGVLIGYETLNSVPSGSKNRAYGFSSIGDTTTGGPCGGVGKAYRPIK